MGKSSEAAAEGRHQVHCKRDENRCITRPVRRCDLDSVECYPTQVILQHRQHSPEAWQADTLLHECKCGEVCGANRGE